MVAGTPVLTEVALKHPVSPSGGGIRPGRRGLSSVQVRSLGWVTTVMILIAVARTVFAFQSGVKDVDRLFDDELRQIVFYAAPHLDHAEERPDPFSTNRDVVLQLRDGRGRVVYTSDPAAPIPAQAARGFATMRIGDVMWRTFAMPHGDGTVQAAQRMSVRERFASSELFAAVVPPLITVPLALGAILWGFRRIRRALSDLATTIASLGVESSEPIPLADVPGEIRPIVRAMNDFSERWRLSLEQQRRFLSDAAHELRTPITALRLQIELMQAGGATASRDPLEALARGTRRASDLVDQLLRMARYDSGEAATAAGDLDVSAVVLDAIGDFVELAAAKGVDLGVAAVESARVRCPERDLFLLVSNLVENAVRYTTPGGVVDVTLRTEGCRAVVEVSDDGPGIPDALKERVFERFFRGPDSGGEGSGLGLAICRAIAVRDGLDLTLRDRPGGGLTARVAIPLASPHL